MKNDDIVEVEVTEEKLNEVSRQSKPKKTLDNYTNKIHFYTSFAYLGSRYGFSAMILAGLAGLVFTILYSENKYSGFLTLLIVCFALCGIAAIFYVASLVARHLAKKYMAKDPNYQDKL